MFFHALNFHTLTQKSQTHTHTKKINENQKQ